MSRYETAHRVQSSGADSIFLRYLADTSHSLGLFITLIYPERNDAPQPTLLECQSNISPRAAAPFSHDPSVARDYKQQMDSAKYNSLTLTHAFIIGDSSLVMFP